LQWLQEIRGQLRLTQQQAADICGISRFYYIKIETRGIAPPVRTAKRIAQAMGFDWTMFYEEIS